LIDDKPVSGHAKLRVRARLISLLGDELISDEPVAVVELVKNAYDADATKVSVEFMESSAGINSLRIADDGHGMSLDAVIEGWFEAGTVMKKRKRSSPAGRPYQGAKGIGRFASARLGDSLLIETKEDGTSVGVSVLISWGRFDDESYLDDIELEYQLMPIPELRHGTVLLIDNLTKRKYWDEDAFQTLHNRLSRLISPFTTPSGKNELNDFAIELRVPGFPQFTGRVEPHALTRKPRYRLAGAISQDGLFSGRIEFEGRPHKEFTRRRLGAATELPSCGAFEVEIRAWDRDRPSLAPFMQKFDLNLTTIRRILDEYSGVNIYRDGFRVYPYGEPGNDWLELDTRSRQNPTMHLANNQVIAAIKISREANQGLKDRSNREGLVHSKEYFELKKWFVEIIKLLEEERYALRPRPEETKKEIFSLFEPFDLSEVRTEVSAKLGPHHPLSILLEKKDTNIRDAIHKLQEHYSRFMMTAGFGQLVDIAVHEIGAPLGRANREVASIERLISKELEPPIITRFSEKTNHLKEYLLEIGQRRDALIPKTAGRRGRATSFAVQDEIEGNLCFFEGLVSRQKVKVGLKLPKDAMVVHMPRSVLGQVISNLLDNSLYWLGQHHGPGGGGRLEIRLAPLEHGFAVNIQDDGPGIADEDRERIFEMNFSKKPNGMGLGLFIAREVMEPFGKLTLSDTASPGGACFEARFERNVGL
jgi:signal transduction histidine kinase